MVSVFRWHDDARNPWGEKQNDWRKPAIIGHGLGLFLMLLGGSAFSPGWGFTGLGRHG